MKGIYALLIRQPSEIELEVGSLGKVQFLEGGYAYIGSALGGLEGRIKRHLGDEKKIYWHIDYFLEKATVQKVVYGLTEEEKECEIAKRVSEYLDSIEGFGSSDCNCNSHLFHGGYFSKVEKRVKTCFRNANLTIEEW